MQSSCYHACCDIDTACKISRVQCHRDDQTCGEKESSKPSCHRGIAILCALLDGGVAIDSGALSPFALEVKIEGNVWTAKSS